MNQSRKIILLLVVAVMAIACNDGKSLQQYYVENAEKPEFISVDFPASMLSLEETDLTAEQKEAYKSLKKLNILAFRVKADNKENFEAEKAKVKDILKNSQYEELMKISYGGAKGHVSMIGDDNSIDELVVYGNDDKFGFALIRVLGDEMEPAKILSLVNALQSADLDANQFKELGEFFKN